MTHHSQQGWDVGAQGVGEAERGSQEGVPAGEYIKSCDLGDA